MTTPAPRHAVHQSLHSFTVESLPHAARALFQTLGYKSDRTVEVASPTDFLAQFNRDDRFNAKNALLDHWQDIHVLFQLTDDDILQSSQGRIAFHDADALDPFNFNSYLFLALALQDNHYTRTQLAQVTREVNKLFPMPALILFRHGQTLTFSIIHRRPHKRDAQRDVLEKVTLVKDINFANAHRAHIEILYDLSLPRLYQLYRFKDFNGLHRAWQTVLDSSELNKKFFKELADWYFWAVDTVTFPPAAGPDETRNAMSVIRLITRLIFVWFLKEKGLVPWQLFDENSLRRDILHWDADFNESTYYKGILLNLFFATLNHEMDNPRYPRRWRGKSNTPGGRDSHYGVPNVYRYESYFQDPDETLALFKTIPFLNGGLFECLDFRPDDGPRVLVDGFSDRDDNPLRVPDELFFGDPRDFDLNAAYGTSGRRYQVRGLINILHRYKFTVEENTPIEEEIALDPELLGQVFENLLAAYNPETETTARKQTGSFYTPREVVDFMVDESLLAYLQTELTNDQQPSSGERDDLRHNLRHLLTYNDEPPQFDPHRVARLIRAIDKVNLIDPAVGSGAFPMGVLNKLVFVLGKLDPGNERWYDRQIAKAEEIDDIEERKAKIAEIQQAFAENRLDYSRKLYLIQNCIYGVDIQPIAVQIAKLRFFISLVVDQTVDDDRPNRGILPLPNLETRFVAANTLLGVDRPSQDTLRSSEIIRLEAELESVRRRMFTARTWQTKQKYRARDRELRQQLSEHLRREGFGNEVTQKLANWDPYAQNAGADFFDPEWMFGVHQGFDIVIGNPPYVRQEKLEAFKPAFKKQYDCYTGTADLFVYFFEAGFRFLSPGGLLTYICSNKYFRSGYGKKLRRYLAQKSTVHHLIDFGDAPVFTAIAYPSIILLQKQPPDDNRLHAFNWEDGPPVTQFPTIYHRQRFRMPQSALKPDGWRLESEDVLRLLQKLRNSGVPLGDYVDGRFYYGIKTGLNAAFIVDRPTRDHLIAQHPSSAGVLRPFLRGRNVKRWRVEFDEQYVIFTRRGINIDEYPAIKEYLAQFKERLMPKPSGWKGNWPGRKAGSYEWYEIQDTIAYWEEFERPKIILPAIANGAEYAIDTLGHYGNDKTSICVADDIYYLAGLLNSNLLWWFIRKTAASRQHGYYEFKPMYVTDIPIVETANKKPIEKLVKEILDRKDASKKTGILELESEIDRLVYDIYKLTPAEIAIIEGRDAGEIEALLGAEASTGDDLLSAPPLMFTGQPPQGNLNQRMKRVRELAQKPTPAAIQELTAALDDPEYTIRYLAAGSLHRLATPEVVGVLKAYLEQADDGPGKEEAEKVLGRLGS